MKQLHGCLEWKHRIALGCVFMFDQQCNTEYDLNGYCKNERWWVVEHAKWKNDKAVDWGHRIIFKKFWTKIEEIIKKREGFSLTPKAKFMRMERKRQMAPMCVKLRLKKKTVCTNETALIFASMVKMKKSFKILHHNDCSSSIWLYSSDDMLWIDLEQRYPVSIPMATKRRTREW